MNQNAISRLPLIGFGLILIGVVVILLSSCATYVVTHTETDPKTGRTFSTRLVETVPPGCKKVSEGSADIGINDAGDWHVKVGASGNTDTNGTAVMINHAMDKAFELGQKAATTGALVP